MGNKELVDFVNFELPNEDGWWDESNAKKYHKAAGTLLSLGMSVEDIKAILSDLYNAVVDEFGG